MASAISSVAISGAVEGLVDEAILRRVVREAGATLAAVHGRNGKDYLRRHLKGYNAAARTVPWVVLVDLDSDAECAPPFVASWLPQPAAHMSFRVAVREAEAWLLADRERIAAFLAVPVSSVPGNADCVVDPKLLIVNLARGSRRRDIREDMTPRADSGRLVGPAYSSRLIEFIEGRWRPRVAAQGSDSLRRFRLRVAEMVGERR